MLDKNGKVCEFDGYVVPKTLPDTPEREVRHREAVEEGRKLVQQIKNKQIKE